MKFFPFINLNRALALLRISVALIFMAHAAVRIGNGTISRFAQFLEGKGLPAGTVVVWLVTIYELGGGLLLVVNKATRWVAAGFILLLLAGILIIHASLGWFVGEHGTGGMEYSFVLIVSLLVIAADRKMFRK